MATWRKLLWVDQPFADNYVDATFLSTLRRNYNVESYQYWTVVAGWSLVVANAAVAVTFALVFVLLREESLAPTSVSAAGTVAALAVGLRWAALEAGKGAAWPALKGALLVVVVIRALSPVFLSLTRTTSSDSIWSIASWLCSLNLLLASRPWKRDSKSLVLSTNFALCGTIVLASRLSTALSVFHFMLFSIETYIVVPAALRLFQARSRRWYWATFVVVISSADVLIGLRLGPLALVAWQVPQIVLLFAFPALFLTMHRYKDQIEGPWDPARPVIW